MNQQSNKRKISQMSADNMEENDTEDATMMTSLEDTVIQQITDLQKDLHAKSGVIQRLEEIEAGFADITDDYSVLKANYEQLKTETKQLRDEQELMKSILIAKDKEIEQLKTQVMEQQTKSLQNNLLLHNVPEIPNEDCLLTVRNVLINETYLTEEMLQTMPIARAHRIGTPNTGSNKKPRLIVVTFTSLADRDTLLAVWNVKPQKKPLQTTQNQNFSTKVTSHLPSEIMAQRSLNIQMINTMKKKAAGQTLDTKIVGTRAYVNNNLMRPLVTKPSVEDLLSTTKEEKSQIQKLQSSTSHPVMELGSSFLAEAVKTTKIQQVRQAYKRVLLDPNRAKATHNILVYKVGEDVGWIEDGEFGAGRFLTTWLNKQKVENCAIIITRQYGGQHLGTRRYEIMKDVCQEAHKRLLKK